MSVRAKFRVNSITEYSYSRTIRLVAVYPDKDNPENKSFWDATPSGTMELNITNPEAFSQFKVEQDFYIDFTPAPKKP